MASRVLIVEDERDIRDLIVLHLQRDSYQVSTAGSGEDALLQVRQSPPDLVLLDLMLPAMSGLEVCRRLRQEQTTATLPILMLTAKADEVDRVVGLELGADDYVVKPFSPKELLARVRALLRRSRPVQGAGPMTFGALTIDPGTHRASVGGESVALTPKEFDLLRALMEARGRVLSREFLLDRVWDYSHAHEVESRTVDVHVRRLRVKLGVEGRRILTVKSVGYRFEPESG
jgi:phosphate regulon transcriptional regulator PhoB